MKRSLILLSALLLAPLAKAQPVFQVGGNLTASTTNCTISAGCVVAVLPTQNGNPNAGVASVVLGGTYVGTNQFEQTAGPANCDPTVPDNATNACTWISATAFPQPSGASVTSATGTGTWLISVIGMVGFRVRNSAFTSGSVTVTITPSVVDPIFSIFNGTITVSGTVTANQGTAAATHGSPWWVRLTDGTTDLTFGQQLMASSIPVAIASNQSAITVTPGPSASGGIALTYFASAALEASHAAIKTGAGTLYGITVYSTNAAVLLIQCADSTTVPGDGAVTPLLTFAVGATPQNGGWTPGSNDFPIPFNTGLSCWGSTATTTPFTKALSTASLVFQVAYK